MPDTVDVVFSHFSGDYSPGQRVTLPRDEAKAFIRAGQAVAATKPDARAVHADPETAASAKPKA